MTKLSIFVTTLLSVLAVTASGNIVHATPNTTTDCKVIAVGSENTAGNTQSRFTVKDNTVSVQLTVTGTNCNLPVTIVSWQAPDGIKGMPYSEQKLFAHNTTTLASGTQTLSVTIPDCYFQVDVVPGTSPTDSQGGPEYNAYGGRKLLGSLHGGTQTCVAGGAGSADAPQPPATPEVLPNTGAGNVLALAGLSTIAGAIAFSLKQRSLSR